MLKVLIKICFFFIFLLITNCGFKVLDKATNNFIINDIKTTGDKRINFKIKNKLLINNNKDSKNVLSLDIITKKIKTIKEKNIKNEITKYKVTLNVIMKFNVINDDISGEINISSESDYLVGDNISITISNEKKVVDNLLEDISKKILDEINFKLNDI
jgi:outer membrane lipopolysaccharide assembly protein LptE/RlpB